MVSTDRVLVIGSGFGGAISAARLAKAGFEVTLLERGPWRDSVPVRSMGLRSGAPLPTGRHLISGFLRSIRTPRGRITLNKQGFLEAYIGNGLKILSASNVGGGSHAYLALHMRPPEPGFWASAGLSGTEMDRHYETVMAKWGRRYRLRRTGVIPSGICWGVRRCCRQTMPRPHCRWVCASRSSRTLRG